MINSLNERLSRVWKIIRMDPTFDSKAILSIDALTPLSMVASFPGSYYRSQPYPTKYMLWGLLENVVGIHLPDKNKKELIHNLPKQQRGLFHASNSGFTSLFSAHIRFSVELRPAANHFDDYWSQLFKGNQTDYVKGSRDYDYRAIPLMNAYAQKNVIIDEKSGYETNPSIVTNFSKEDKIHTKALRSYFPQFYPSPTPREYVEWNGQYKTTFETNADLLSIIQEAIEQPAAPPYLGSSDGWIDLNLKKISK